MDKHDIIVENVFKNTPSMNHGKMKNGTKRYYIIKNRFSFHLLYSLQ